MAAKLTRLAHKIAIQLHLVAQSYTICSSRSRRPVRKLLDTPSCVYTCVCVWGGGVHYRTFADITERPPFSQMPINGDFASMVGYLISVTFQLVLYCKFGSNLMTQVSTKLHFFSVTFLLLRVSCSVLFMVTWWCKLFSRRIYTVIN
jgi:hypothetical protein